MAVMNHPGPLAMPTLPREDVLDRPFQCTQPDCIKSYTRAWLLRKHVKAEHQGIRFPCPSCDTIFKYENDLRQHQLRIHRGQRRYACVSHGYSRSNCACGQSFATSSELYRHQRKSKPKVRAKARVTERCAQQDIQPLTAFLQPITMDPAKQVYESIFEDPASITDATAFNKAHFKPDEKHDPAPPRVGRSRKLHGPNDTAELPHNDVLLCRQERIAHSIMRFASTSSIELALDSVRTYVLGSFEAGTWVLTKNNSTCRSIKADATPESKTIYSQMLVATRALDDGDFQSAKYHFSHICGLAKAWLEGEEVNLISRLVEVLLVYCPLTAGGDKTPLQASLGLVTRHFARMAAIVHGSAHPLTIILKTLHKHTTDENPEPGLRMIFEQLLVCHEQMLGPYNSQCIWLKLRIINPENGSSAKIWEFLESCDRVCGFDSHQSYSCLQHMIDQTIHVQRNYSLNEREVPRMLENMATRILKIQNPQLVKWYTLASSNLKFRWFFVKSDWHGAADTIEHELIPLELKEQGELSMAIVALLSDLEYCLECVGNFDRLEEIRLWRQSIEKGLFAEEDGANGEGCENWDQDLHEDGDDDEHEEDNDVR